MDPTSNVDPATFSVAFTKRSPLCDKVRKALQITAVRLGFSHMRYTLSYSTSAYYAKNSCISRFLTNRIRNTQISIHKTLYKRVLLCDSVSDIKGVRFLSAYTPSRRDSSRTPTYLPCSIRARVASDMIVGQVRGSLLTLTIVNLSWHAMEVSIQETTVAVRRGITAAALESQAIEPGCLCQSCQPPERTANAWRK